VLLFVCVIYRRETLDAKFQLYHGENKLQFDVMMMMMMMMMPAVILFSNHIGGLMIRLLASCAVENGFELLSGMTED
jgi:stage III sporulation protein SpoIIIAA